VPIVLGEVHALWFCYFQDAVDHRSRSTVPHGRVEGFGW
jgi:hypothetical protein